MQTPKKLLLTFVAVAGTLAAQSPTFTGIVNAASGIPPGSPGYGIAQGAVFVAYGANLGPSTIALAQLPLPTTAGLATTTMTVTVGGTTVPVPVLYTVSSQVAGIIPSGAPAGTGTLNLTYNGKSGSFPVTVLTSGFGVSTVSPGSGGGPAVVTFANYQLVTATNTAKPGDTLILWGTGLGATTAAGDTGSGGAPPAGNIGPTPSVFVGGVLSPNVAYAGRSPGSPGLDQIVFVVPPTAPQGCNVSIMVQTGGSTPVTSNGPTMSIAATDGATCSDPTQYIPTSALSKNSVKAMALAIKQNVSTSINGSSTTTTTTNTASVQFFQFSQAQLAAQAQSINSEPTYRSCVTGFVAAGAGGGGPNATPLNAGPSVTLTPPSGKVISMTASSTGQYSAAGGGGGASSLSGLWGFSSAGGSDIGPLNFTFPIPQQIVWNNEGLISGSTIDRTKPLTITWTGGDTIGYVDIQGQAQIGPVGASTYTVYFDCAAPTSDQQFTIPSYILATMPAGASAQAGIQVSTYALPYSLGAVPGLDAALDNSQFQASTPVIYK